MRALTFDNRFTRELPADPEGLYRLVQDDEVFFADPLARRFGWDRFGEYSQVDPLPERGHHERWWAFDEGAGLLQPRTVTAYLPAGAFDEGGNFIQVAYSPLSLIDSASGDLLDYHVGAGAAIGGRPGGGTGTTRRRRSGGDQHRDRRSGAGRRR